MNKKQDLGVKIGSKEEKAWKDLALKQEESKLSTKMELEIVELIEEYAKKRAIEEKEKFRKL